jgi:hypothetical protein
MKFVVVTVPTETVNYVRPTFTSQWHIAVGKGRKPSGKTICGIKRDGYWADSSVSPRADTCKECSPA